MKSLRRLYYDLFSKVYDFIIRLHSRDIEGSPRRFITEKANLSKGDRALDLCTGTGSVAVELAKQVGENGLVVGLDFSRGMLKKAKEKARRSKMDWLYLVQANASQLPFKNSSIHGVTCSHAFYELKREERTRAINEVARVLKRDGKFCLMEHAKPEKLFPRLLFYIRLLFLGSKDARKFLMEEGSIFGESFKNITKVMSPTGKSKLIYGEKGDNAMELSIEEKWKRSRAALSMLLGTSLKAISESYGKQGLEKVAKAWEENNKKAAKRLMEIVGRQERNLETVARIIDFTDSIYGVEGDWTEIGSKRAIKIEKSCPLAKQFPPETCTMCFSGSMQGIARGVLGHDKVVCRMPKSLPGGDNCCEIIIEVKE